MLNFSRSLTLVLGGQRSGKSAYAEALIGEETKALYVATAQAFDEEMTARVATHKKRRGSNWITLEEPFDLAGVVVANSGSSCPVLIDSLAAWVSNLIVGDKDFEKQTENFIDALRGIKSSFVIVSDEVGQGIIPDNALARRFIDALGKINQLIAAQADTVVFVTAGLPRILKGKE